MAMIIDAYDLLGIEPDAELEDVKKAFKRLSLQHHPDKVQAQGNDKDQATEKFLKIKEASDLLQDDERRKLYDALGLDFGADSRPEAEVWNAGFAQFGTPGIAVFLKTILSRLALWLLAFRFLTILLLLCGIVAAVAYAANFKYREFRIRDPDVYPVLFVVAIAEVAILLNWIWPFLGEVICIVILAVQAVPEEMMGDKRVWIAGVPVSFLLAWLCRGRWFWITLLEIGLGIILLLSIAVATGIVRLWLDNLQQQKTERLKTWRKDMRRERKRLEDEIAALKKQLDG
mmetsp:Transcript_50129/g.119322  ORF Transcript_50129/g.119322 Transcript_50129/m.119322 type:complete len:287 (-) Transcript_50129:66-926(-)